MLNQIKIMGRLTRDPELRRTGSGIAVASFTLAVDRDIADQSGNRETDFIDCVAWRQTGEFVSKYFHKGSMAVVAGRLQIRSWTDKENHKRKSAEVVANNVYFGESKCSADGNSQGGHGGTYGASAYPETMDAINRYSAPNGCQPGDYAELTDDDGQLPF